MKRQGQRCSEHCAAHSFQLRSFILKSTEFALKTNAKSTKKRKKALCLWTRASRQDKEKHRFPYGKRPALDSLKKEGGVGKGSTHLEAFCLCNWTWANFQSIQPGSRIFQRDFRVFSFVKHFSLTKR